SEHVAGGDVEQPEVLAQALRLRALAGARGAEDDQIELRHRFASLPAQSRSARNGPRRNGRSSRILPAIACTWRLDLGARPEPNAFTGRLQETGRRVWQLPQPGVPPGS